jgi:hypothetical protein
MFKSSQGPEFELKYNAETGEGDGIAAWYDAWVATGDKIDIPK